MSWRGAAVALVAFSLVLGNVSEAAAPTAPGTVLEPGPRLMVVGDSVAHQFAGDYTWRFRLAQEFKRQQAPINFVGPFKWAYGKPDRYLTDGWDSDHDAQGATVIKNFRDLDPVPGAPAWGRNNIVTSMKAYQPDVIVVMLGNNDVNNLLAGFNYGIPSIRDGLRYYGRDWAEPKVDLLVRTVVDDYRALLASARTVRPDVKIVIAEITSQLIDPWIRDKVNAAFATDLASTATSPITIAPTDDERWSRPGFTVDGIHPTPTGDLLMAQRIAAGIHQLPRTPLPRSPQVPQHPIAWNPPLVPDIAVEKSRIRVQTAESARASTVLQVRIRASSASGRPVTGAAVGRYSWISGSLTGGTYRIQIQGIRKQMRTPWSRIYTVKVPTLPVERPPA